MGIGPRFLKGLSMRRRSSSAEIYKPKTDLFQRVTDKIITVLEQGTLPWRKPWKTEKHSQAALCFPVNAITGRAYSGMNVVLLWMDAAEKGFSSNRWLTFGQALEVGGNVRKGEKATLVTFYKPEQPPIDEPAMHQCHENAGALKSQRSFMTSNHLFNVEQCENLPEKLMLRHSVELPDQHLLSIARADQIVANSGVRVIHKFQSHSFYRPQSDTITLPARTQFDSQATYYSTMMHELVHSTGHESRLARDGIVSCSRKFGDPVYALEELVAEFGAAFLCAELGLNLEVQHESYIASWLKVLRGDNRAIFKACRLAREAFEYLINHEQA